MTYCVGLKIDSGLVFMSDTRTNAGIEFDLHLPQDACLGGGRRARHRTSDRGQPRHHPVRGQPARRALQGCRRPLADAPGNAIDVSDGAAGRQHRARGDRRPCPGGRKANSYFNASFILGGQIRGTEPRLFQIYPEGNFIECSEDTPFFQIGETKYGKPIIVRAYDRAMSFAETAKLLMVSFNSTLKSNLSVGLPLDLMFYQKDSMRIGFRKRIGIDDPYYRTVSDGWSNALKTAFKSLPDFPEA